MHSLSSSCSEANQIEDGDDNEEDNEEANQIEDDNEEANQIEDEDEEDNEKANQIEDGDDNEDALRAKGPTTIQPRATPWENRPSRTKP